jgi:hypothetical protein
MDETRVGQQGMHSITTGDVRHHRNMATTANNCSMCGAEDSWRHSLLESSVTWPGFVQEDVSVACSIAHEENTRVHVNDTYRHDS